MKEAVPSRSVSSDHVNKARGSESSTPLQCETGAGSSGAGMPAGNPASRFEGQAVWPCFAGSSDVPSAGSAASA